VNSESLTYVPMYSCNDGTIAATCNDWIITTPDSGGDTNMGSNTTITITTWWVLMILVAGVLLLGVVIGYYSNQARSLSVESRMRRKNDVSPSQATIEMDTITPNNIDGDIRIPASSTSVAVAPLMDVV
jgi:hypothetical protein